MASKILTPDEWSAILDGSCPGLPPCCQPMLALRSSLRQIRDFEIDVVYARELLYTYDYAAELHDLSMYPAVLKVVEHAEAKADNGNVIDDVFGWGMGCW